MGRRQKEDADSLPSGFLVIDKVQNMTSHDVVAIARGALQIRKIGHTGTLDPMATGLLVLLINKATKIQDKLMAEDKVYQGTLKLGVTTDSQDAEGDPVEEKEVLNFSDQNIDDAFNEYVGPFEQMPPMVSAIKKDGVRLYKLARQGKVVEREPRPVRVDDYHIHRTELPEIDFTVECSKGFYVRTYAHDIGQKLGCGGHLSALRRTSSGKIGLTNAIPAMDLKTMGREAILERLVSLEDLVDLYIE